MSDSAKPLLVCLGHHKCASTTVHNIFAALVSLAGRRWAYVGNLYPDDLAAYAREQHATALSLGNADPARLNELGDFRGFHLIRDPRDIVVSAYFSHRYSHPTDDWEDLAAHREELSKLSMEEGLLRELDFWPTRVTLERMSSWNYNDPRILETRFVDFIADLPAWVRRWAEFFGLTNEPQGLDSIKAAWNGLCANRRGWNRLCLPLDAIPVAQIDAVSAQFSFDKLSGGREQGQKDKASHYRSGKPGEWQQHFSPRLREAFLERFPGVLEKTGYAPFDEAS